MLLFDPLDNCAFGAVRALLAEGDFFLLFSFLSPFFPLFNSFILRQLGVFFLCPLILAPATATFLFLPPYWYFVDPGPLFSHFHVFFFFSLPT